MSAHDPVAGRRPDGQDLRVHRDSEGRDVLRVIGEMDLSTVPILRSAVEEVMRDNSGSVLLDLAGVTFVDSSGLALMLEIAAQVPTFGVVNPSPAARRLIAISGLETVLKVAP